MELESEQSEEQFESGAEPQSDREDVATLAFRLWQERGCPDGSSQVDWFQAEQLLSEP
jgi:hypothetical protein